MNNWTFLSNSQKHLIRQLREEWLLVGCTDPVIGIKTRAIPLIVGPSGTGKSLAIGRLAEKLQVPCLNLSSGAWIVSGAYVQPATLKMVADFVKQEDRGIIFLDEIDKLVPRQGTENLPAWSLGVFTEVLALLDRSHALAHTAGWSQDLWLKFNTGKFLLVAAGTWQDLCKPEQRDFAFDGELNALYNREEQIARELKARYRRRLGYANLQANVPAVFLDQVEYLHRIEQSGGLGAELLNRFNQDLLLLAPPNRADFARAIIGIHRSLSLELPDRLTLQTLVQQAELSERGMRWLEYYVKTLLKTRHAAVARQFAPTINQPKAEVLPEPLISDYDVFKTYGLCRDLITHLLEYEPELRDDEKTHQFLYGELEDESTRFSYASDFDPSLLRWLCQCKEAARQLHEKLRAGVWPLREFYERWQHGLQHMAGLLKQADSLKFGPELREKLGQLRKGVYAAWIQPEPPDSGDEESIF